MAPRVLHVVRYGTLLVVGSILGFLFAADGLRAALPDREPGAADDALTKPRFVVLGFDGVDHRILEERMQRGECPNLRALRDTGTFLPLGTELPPESPVAWASLLTGVNPGRHGITDFVIPGPGYSPQNGMVDVSPMRLFGRMPIRLPVVTSRLRAETFLERVWKAGYPVLSLRQPHSFPATLRPGLRLLSGLGTPDLSGAAGLYTVWSNEIGAVAGDTVFGGFRVPISPDGTGRRFETYLPGPFDPTLTRGPHGERRRTSIPIAFERIERAGAPAVRIVLQGQEDVVSPKERSRFLEVAFRIGTWPPIERRGHVRFEVIQVDPLKVMADPLQPSLTDTRAPIASPPEYGAELLDRYGLFETIGWPEQTFALNDLVQDDRGFLRDLLDDMDRGAGILLGELRRGGRCVFYAFTATDRAYHGFFRYYDKGHPAHDTALRSGLVDPAGDVYARMDKIVGDVRATLDPEDVLFVVSDHGFQTWRYAVNVNQWLVDKGYMVLRTGEAGTRRMAGLFSGEIDGSDVDWPKTRAYAMGLGQVFLNLRDRESEGVVDPKDAPALIAEISKGLLEIENPMADGEKAILGVYRLQEVYHGPHAHEAAEMQIGFAEGYRISWQTALLGGMSEHGPVIQENLVPWSGDHCSTDPRRVPGVLLSNRRIPPPKGEGYSLRDIAPTVLDWYGVDWRDLDGRPIPLDAGGPDR